MSNYILYESDMMSSRENGNRQNKLCSVGLYNCSGNLASQENEICFTKASILVENVIASASELTEDLKWQNIC